MSWFIWISNPFKPIFAHPNYTSASSQEVIFLLLSGVGRQLERKTTGQEKVSCFIRTGYMFHRVVSNMRTKFEALPCLPEPSPMSNTATCPAPGGETHKRRGLGCTLPYHLSPPSEAPPSSFISFQPKSSWVIARSSSERCSIKPM